MAEFSATDAALEGFRITRERPRDVAIWAGFILVCTLFGTILAILLAGEAINAFQEAGRSPPQDGSELLERFAGLGPLAVVLGPLALIYGAVLSSAVYRAVLRPEEGGVGLLRLGMDEVRVAVATFLLALLAVLIVLGLAIVFGLILGGAAAAGSGPALGIAGLLAVVGFIAGGIWISVRLSLALPMTFYERRIRIFESWRLTKGRFWPLFGAYVLALVLLIVISLLGMMIYFAVAAVAGGGLEGASEGMRPDYSSIGTWLGPATLISLVFGAALNAVTNAIQMAPAAVAYRDLAGVGHANPAEVFS